MAQRRGRQQRGWGGLEDDRLVTGTLRAPVTWASPPTRTQAERRSSHLRSIHGQNKWAQMAATLRPGLWAGGGAGGWGGEQTAGPRFWAGVAVGVVQQGVAPQRLLRQVGPARPEEPGPGRPRQGSSSRVRGTRGAPAAVRRCQTLRDAPSAPLQAGQHSPSLIWRTEAANLPSGPCQRLRATGVSVRVGGSRAWCSRWPPHSTGVGA